MAVCFIKHDNDEHCYRAGWDNKAEEEVYWERAASHKAQKEEVNRAAPVHKQEEGC